jgi:hypothetical protein
MIDDYEQIFHDIDTWLAAGDDAYTLSSLSPPSSSTTTTSSPSPSSSSSSASENENEEEEEESEEEESESPTAPHEWPDRGKKCLRKGHITTSKRPMMGKKEEMIWAPKSRRSTSPICCRRTSSLIAVIMQALAHRESYVWVTEPDDSLVGIVTFADILTLFLNHIKNASL